MSLNLFLENSVDVNVVPKSFEIEVLKLQGLKY